MGRDPLSLGTHEIIRLLASQRQAVTYEALYTFSAVDDIGGTVRTFMSGLPISQANAFVVRQDDGRPSPTEVYAANGFLADWEAVARGRIRTSSGLKEWLKSKWSEVEQMFGET
ncbi:MAG: hypothetical protein AB7I45_01360 [Planctomycetota bacterium]